MSRFATEAFRRCRSRAACDGHRAEKRDHEERFEHRQDHAGLHGKADNRVDRRYHDEQRQDDDAPGHDRPQVANEVEESQRVHQSRMRIYDQKQGAYGHADRALLLAVRALWVALLSE